MGVFKSTDINTFCCLWDITNILRKQQLIAPSKTTILTTRHVEALYVIIPHKDGLQAIRNVILDYDATAYLTAEICQFVFMHNCFRFGNSLHLQINSTVVACMASSCTNVINGCLTAVLPQLLPPKTSPLTEIH